MTKRFATRFAPSPTGYLHLGHAFSALTAYDAAREAGGTFELRIEDIDQVRCKAEYETAILEDLAWLGLKWQTPVRRQSDHFGDYAAALEKLRKAGLVYRCFKTRKEVLAAIASAPHLPADGPEGPQYYGGPLPPDEENARIDAGEAFAWRLSMATARDHLGARFDHMTFTEEGRGPRGESGVITAEADIFGDVVIARKDAGTSYHLAAVWDDGAQGITHVIRGEDLFPAAHLHRLLQELLELPAPVYRHHRMVTDENGRRFAKRDRDATLRALRSGGATPSGIRRMLGLPQGDDAA